jgi:hypothetical protein
VTIPTFFDAAVGSDSTGADNLAPAYPAAVAANDIAIVHYGCRGTPSATMAPPGDWSVVEADHNPGTLTLHHGFAWKRLAGTESSSTITITGGPGGGVGTYGRIYVFRGCVTSGTPYEAEVARGGSVSTTYSSQAITTLGTDRLAVCLVMISDDDKTLGGITGSNVTWAPTTTQFASGSGSDATLFCQQANVAAITSITAGSESYSGSESWSTFTFALIPADSYQPRHGFVNYQNPGVFAVARDAWRRTRPGIVVPKLWTPRPVAAVV